MAGDDEHESPPASAGPPELALRRAQEDALHGLANAWHIMRAGREELAALVQSEEAQLILEQMRQADERCGGYINRLRQLI